jgi:hypothetical protein
MQLGEVTTAMDGRTVLERLVDTDRIQAARRKQIRARLASFMDRDGRVLEQFDIGEFGIETIRVGAPGLRP